MLSWIAAPFMGLLGSGRPFRAGRACVSVVALSLLSTPAFAKDIKFAGYSWEVRQGGGGPGPNSWSADNAWVDKHGLLHLKIAKRDGKWSCAELTMNQSLGFGRYEFDVDGQLGKMDDSIVLGLFNYPTPDIGPDGTNEIDIEFATWGGQQKKHGNWTVWPPKKEAKQGSYIFDLPDTMTSSLNAFEWSSHAVQYDCVPFQIVLRKLMPIGTLGWTYTPDDFENRIPQHPLPVHINLWLFNGKPPTDDKEVEIIVSAFRFTPQAAG